jgi:hypothetical protein
MKLEKGLREFILLLIGLGIVGLVTAAIITTFRKGISSQAQIKASPNPTMPVSKPTTAVPYPYPAENPLTPTTAARQTAAGPLNTPGC